MRTVLVTNNNLNSLLSLSRFLADHGREVRCVVVTTRLPGESNNLVGGMRMLKRSGSGYTVWKVAMNIGLPRWLRARGLPVSVTELMERLGLSPEVVVCGSANEEAVVERIRSHRPEVLLAAGATHVFGQALLSVPSRVGLNLHPSLLPRYAGVAPYFWALARGDHESGATLHVLAPKLDAGPVVDQRVIPHAGIRSVAHLVSRVWDVNNDMLCDFYRGATRLDDAWPQDLAARTYFRHPARSDVRALHARGYALMRPEDLREAARRVERLARELGGPPAPAKELSLHA